MKSPPYCNCFLLSFLIWHAKEVSASCTSTGCGPGSYCGKYLYRPKLGLPYYVYECYQCPAGTFKGCNGCPFATCESCFPGYFQPSVGQASCLGCTQGTFSENYGSVSCTSCPAGKYSSSTANTACTDCLAGYYNPTSGLATACTLQCIPGTYSLSGSTSCTNCSAGSFSAGNGSSTCTACIPGKYQDSNGQSACNNCQLPTISSMEGSKNCTLCQQGTYSESTNRSSCLSCEAGKTTLGNGSYAAWQCTSIIPRLALNAYPPLSGFSKFADSNYCQDRLCIVHGTVSGQAYGNGDYKIYTYDFQTPENLFDGNNPTVSTSYSASDYDSGGAFAASSTPPIFLAEQSYLGAYVWITLPAYINFSHAVVKRNVILDNTRAPRDFKVYAYISSVKP